MAPRLLLAFVLCTTRLPCCGEAVPIQPWVQCWSSRYPIAVDCVWTAPQTANSTGRTSFIATYRLGVAAQGESRPCLHPSPESRHCTIPEVLLFSMLPYVLNVTAIHPTGVSSTFLPFVPEHVIKPDPPESVTLSPLPGQRLGVQWKPPGSWPFPEIFSLKYRIRYKRHGAAHFRQVGPTEATSFVLRAVRPHSRYCVQVSAQELTGSGQPSDWSVSAITAGTPVGERRASTPKEELCP
ncbi:interleukin-27 subunit beta [Sorex araneus]|uniref:interleukin-27 subunit beta n=1 Tax=Sorex araneus TaxID=42254 RepID=UPI00064ADB02|nr:interleukin-27 subunit beta [Sorex araneus]